MKGFELEMRVATWRGEVFWEETACEKALELEELTVLHPQPLLSILSIFQKYSTLSHLRTSALAVPSFFQAFVLAWRILGTGQPGGLPSMGSHRVGHD